MKVFKFLLLKFLIGSIPIVLVIFVVTTIVNKEKKNISVKNNKEYIEKLYKDISGFSISQDEYSMINEKGGNATYGEITYDALATLLQDLNVTDKDIFYDLGCGVGKTCVQALLTTPAKKCVGIDLSPSRVGHAQQIKKILEQEQPILHKTLLFKEANIADTTFDDATIIFTCSTCFSGELMKTITEKFAQLKKGVRILTLQQLPPHDTLVLQKEYTLPMTWSDNVTVYLYIVQ